MKTIFSNKQEQTFPSKASTTARALFDRDPGKLFAYNSKRENIKDFATIYSFLNDELEQRYTITKEIKILIIGTHKKNTDYRHYPSGSGLFHTSAVLSPGLSETDSEFWASSTSIPFFILSWMSKLCKSISKMEAAVVLNKCRCKITEVD
jgi:hypothetical protein